METTESSSIRGNKQVRHRNKAGIDQRKTKYVFTSAFDREFMSSEPLL